jgi:prepilin-type N-terminal cleavage/methylation domain-containing protein
VKAGLTLLEVLIALAILAVVAGLLAQTRLDALRHTVAQREHTTVSHILRSELEALRAGSASEGPCATLSGEPRLAGYACDVREACAFPASMCSGRGGTRGWIVHVTAPSGAEAEVPMLVRVDATRGVVAFR